MRQRIAVVVLALLVVHTTGARAESPELSTPKLAALAFIRAMENDDMKHFADITIGSDADSSLFEPLAGMLGAARQMEKAARQKFGRTAGPIVRLSPALGLDVQIQESDVTIDRDSAFLRQKGQEKADPITLRKTAAGWKVDLTAIRDREKMAAAAPAMKSLRQALSDSAADITAGKFATVEEAAQAITRRLQTAATAKPAAGG